MIETGRIAASDLDEYFTALSAWPVVPTQLSQGRFRGQMEFVRTETVVVYRERWNCRLRVRGESPAGYLMVGAQLHPSAQVEWCGRELSEQRVALSQSSGEIEFTTTDRADHVVALVRSDVVERYLGDGGANGARRARHLSCDAAAGRSLLATLGRITARYATGPELRPTPHGAEDLEAEVLEALAPCAGWQPERGADESRRERALRRAIAHAERHPRPIPVPALAEAAGVSQRTLEYAFRERLGITPQQFLRRLRLNGAHRELRAAAPGATTVTRVANRWGFHELGRFAGEHRRLFGLSPTEVLAKSGSPDVFLHA